MIDFAGCILVENSKGTRFQLYEYRGTRFFWKVRTFVLNTGEPVKRIDFNTYAIATTGEPLVRVDPS